MLSGTVILDAGRLEAERDYFLKQDAFGFDVETTGADRGVPARNTVTWLGLATHGGRTLTIPMGHPIGTRVTGYAREPRQHKNGVRNYKVPVYEPPPPQLARGEVFDILRPLFTSPQITKVAHGATFDLASIAKYYGGQVIPGPHACTLTMRWILDENRRRYGLKYVTRDVYGYFYDDEDVGKKAESYPFAQVSHYLHCDAKYCWLEYLRLRPEITAQGFEDLYELEMRLLGVLSRMRITGVPVDVPRLEAMRADLTGRAEDLEGKIFAAAGQKFNVNSPVQKQGVLFRAGRHGGQGLRPWKLTAGGRKRADAGERPDHTFYSTDAEALEQFRDNPVVRALLEFQETSKILHTYVLGYLGDPSAKDRPCRVYDSRIFPDFVAYGTSTGRFSARDPNLQNIPRAGTELGTLIRGAFRAEPGHRLIVADYNQIELAVLAHFLGHGKLYDGFHEGIDPHRVTAASVLGIPPAEVTREQRQKYGKSLNFAVTYGAGIRKVASMAGVTPAEARAILARHDAEFPEIRRYRAKLLARARAHSVRRTGQPPHVETLLGRKRRVPAVNSRDDGVRKYSERQLFNSQIQGSSADLTKLAMVRFGGLRENYMELLLTVHDELVVSAPAEYAERTAEVLVEAMTGEEIQRLVRVPLTADVGIAERWSDAK